VSISTKLLEYVTHSRPKHARKLRHLGISSFRLAFVFELKDSDDYKKIIKVKVLLIKNLLQFNSFVVVVVFVFVFVAVQESHCMLS